MTNFASINKSSIQECHNNNDANISFSMSHILELALQMNHLGPGIFMVYRQKLNTPLKLTKPHINH